MRYRGGHKFGVTVPVFLIALVLVAGSPGASAGEGSTRCPPAWRAVDPGPFPLTEELLDASFSSPREGWAVGISYTEEGFERLIRHWDGERWDFVPAPSGGASRRLVGVLSLSPTDAWGVGSGGDKGALIERWDGQEWTVVPAKDIPGSLAAIDGISPTDIWSSGTKSGDGLDPLLVHWDGTRWSEADAPSLPDNQGLGGLDHIATDDAWAVGTSVGTDLLRRTLSVHWDGAAWSVVPSPNPGPEGSVLSAVSGTGPEDVWAVGHQFPAGQGTDPLVLHWEGAGWELVPAPRIGTHTALEGVKAVSRHDVWAVGNWSNSSIFGGVVMHYDGEAWSVVHFTRFSGRLRDVDAPLPTAVWAVGLVGDPDPLSPPEASLIMRACPVGVADAGFSPPSPSIHPGEVAAWAFHADGGRHRLVDPSGLDLFDSGPRRPGGSYTHRFHAAGTYPVLDTSTGAEASLAVRLLARPTQGEVEDRYVLRWAARPAPMPFRYDVQLRRPGEASFRWFRYDTVLPEATFTPDAGAGTYLFRARLRDTTTNEFIPWSPEVRIRVE